MYNRRIIFSVIMLLVILGCVVWAMVLFEHRQSGLTVTFFDVGQGDAILISQGSQQILIDGGRDGSILLEKLGKAIPFWDRTIETVIATHPDADHIAGLVDAAKAYKIGAVIETAMKSDSQTYKVWQDVIDKEGCERVEAIFGEKIILGGNAELEILHPFNKIDYTKEKDSNATSVVARLTYGKNNFLFTGDLPIEQELIFADKSLTPIGEPLILAAQVLKVGHHGSKYSTSERFLDMVKPRDAILSVGAHNTYGHPNQEIIDRLRNRGINILRTDKSGDIGYDCKNQETTCVVGVEK